jgi:thiamine phosphate synthase YjbQ (UPF0047 family)
MALASVPPSGNSVFLVDDESGLHQDYEVWLERLAPHVPTSQYQHNRTGQACLRQAPVPNPVLSETKEQ